MSNLSAFIYGETVVHPAHGVGHITCIESQKIFDDEFKVLVINFLRERLTIRIPLNKACSNGLRHLSTEAEIQKALKHLEQPSTPSKKIAWSRRAQEYKNKINSGNPIILAEAIRDLGKQGSLENQSFSEKQLYNIALERFLEEWQAICPIQETEARDYLQNLLLSPSER